MGVGLHCSILSMKKCLLWERRAYFPTVTRGLITTVTQTSWSGRRFTAIFTFKEVVATINLTASRILTQMKWQSTIKNHSESEMSSSLFMALTVSLWAVIFSSLSHSLWRWSLGVELWRCPMWPPLGSVTGSSRSLPTSGRPVTRSRDGGSATVCCWHTRPPCTGQRILHRTHMQQHPTLIGWR